MNLPTLEGTLFVQRNHEILAVDLATHNEVHLDIQTDLFHVSPDGTRIAFVLSSTLAIADINGLNQRILTEGVSRDFVWAPDSHAIALTKGTGSAHWYDCPPLAEIWIAELPSGEMRRIDSGCDPAWSPDSMRLAYVNSYRGFVEQQPPNALYLVNRFGEHRWSPYQAGQGFDLSKDRDMARRYLFDPFWSADGSHVFVAAWVRTYVDIDGSTLEEVDAYQGGAQTVGTVDDWLDPIPSPDGYWVAELGAGQSGMANSTVHILLGEEHSCEQYDWCGGSGLRLRTQRIAWFWYTENLAWSPDSSLLATIYCTPQPAIYQVGATQHHSDRCYEETAVAEVRFINPLTGALSEPLITQVDPRGGIEWRP
jgi:hypothetical protein